MLRVRQDGRRALVLLLLLLIAAGFCSARPQSQPVPEKRDERLPPPATSPGSGAASHSADTTVFHSRQPYSDLVHSRDGHEKDDLRNGRRKQEAEESVAPSGTPRFSKNSTATQLGQSIQTMANQLLTSHLLSDDSMVEADVRTPPKIQSQLDHKHKQSVNGHGVAVPVIIEDGEDVEKTIEKMDRVGSSRVPPPVTVNKTSLVQVTSSPQSTTPSSGFSTWILLSGSNTTNQPTVTRKSKPSFSTTAKPITTRFVESKVSSPLFANNKPTNVLELTSTMTPVNTRPSTLFTRIVTSNPPRKTTTSKPFSAEGNNTHSQTNRTTMKPVLQTLTRRPNPATGSKIKNQTRLDAPTLTKRRKPITVSTTTSRPQATSLSYKEEFPVTVSPDYIEDSTSPVTENDDNITTKRTRRPGSSEKKKKKNKNRHRRPTKKPDEIAELESKVTDEDVNMSNVAATKERPLSTRIYNYLAREVMPSVGVGLLGLVFTAGLAGLIMYPFGGGAARKTYEELETSQGGYYGFNSDVDREGGMSDAEAFGKVLAGMKESQMAAYNNAGSANTVYGAHEATYGDATSRYGGGRVDSSQESGNVHSEAKQHFVGSQSVPNQKYGEDYSRNKYVSSFPVYQTGGGVRYRQVGIGSSYPVNHQTPDTQEVTLEDKITPVAVQGGTLYGTSKTSSVQRGPVAQPAVEHGPRSITRRKRDVSPEKNDMDNEIIPSVTKDQKKQTAMNSIPKSPEIAKTDKFTESTTTILPTEKTENSTNSLETSEVSMIGVPDLQNVLDVETTTDSGTSEDVTLNPTTAVFDEDHSANSVTMTEESGVPSTTTATSSQDQFSFLGFLRQLIQFKVQLGLNFLRNSSTAFTRYLDGVQKRMNESYRTNVKRSANIQEIRNRTKLRG